MSVPGLTWGGTPTPPLAVTAWQQKVGYLAGQWRDGSARGPVWFGRQRRRELVAMPSVVWWEVWGAAIAALDASLAQECTSRLALTTEATTVPAAAVAQATGETNPTDWVGALRAHPAVTGDLTSLTGGGSGLCGYLLADEGNLVEISETPLLWRGLYWTPEQTWVTVWHEGILVLARPAPSWLSLSLADGPTVPDRET